MEFYNNHKKLFTTALLFFVALTVWIAVWPAFSVQRGMKPLPNAPKMTAEEEAGRAVYIREGCVYCHTQQVRNLDMDDVFGARPSIAADYAGNGRVDFWRNTADLMGTERTGPDLTDIGKRQPSPEWHLTHLYNPRALVKESIMPAFHGLFVVKAEPGPNDVEVTVPAEFKKNKDDRIFATQDAKNLVAYLLSRKQAELPTGREPMEFLYKKKAPAGNAAGGNAAGGPDGAALFTTHCAACHQANGEGLPGAFPPLKGSPVVTGENLELYLGIIMKGYDARPDYAVMPPVGKDANLSPAEIAAIMNHERESWGNGAAPVKEEDVKKIIDNLK